LDFVPGTAALSASRTVHLTDFRNTYTYSCLSYGVIQVYSDMWSIQCIISWCSGCRYLELGCASDWGYENCALCICL